MFWRLVYNLFAVPVMFVGFYVAGCCNPKIQEGIKGRKRVFAELTAQLQTARQLEKTINVGSMRRIRRSELWGVSNGR